MSALFNWQFWAGLVLAFYAGLGLGVKVQKGEQANIDIQAGKVRAAESRRMALVMDNASTAHVTEVVTLSKQLGDAREHNATLSNRRCLDARTVGVLNNIGSDPAVRAAASEPESTAPSATPGGGLRYSTERDVSSTIATCRAKYFEVNSQLNQILDIEDARWPVK